MPVSSQECTRSYIRVPEVSIFPVSTIFQFFYFCNGVVLIYVITSIHKILLLIFVENKDEVSDFVQEICICTNMLFYFFICNKKAFHNYNYLCDIVQI